MNQTAGRYSGTSSNPAAWQDCGVGPDPDIVLDDDVPPQSSSSAFPPFFRVDWICRTHEVDIRAKDDVITNRDRTGVCDATIWTNYDVLSDLDIIAIIAVERCFHMNACANTANR